MDLEIKKGKATRVFDNSESRSATMEQVGIGVDQLHQISDFFPCSKVKICIKALKERAGGLRWLLSSPLLLYILVLKQFIA